MPHKAFITNTKTKTLKKRIEQLIEYSRELKFLVGFFYFSGWQQIYLTLKENENLKLKILVGLEVDSKLGKTIEYALSDNQISNDENQTAFLNRSAMLSIPMKWMCKPFMNRWNFLYD